MGLGLVIEGGHTQHGSEDFLPGDLHCRIDLVEDGRGEVEAAGLLQVRRACGPPVASWAPSETPCPDHLVDLLPLPGSSC